MYLKPCTSSNNTEVSIYHKLQQYDITWEFEIYSNEPDFWRWYINTTFTILVIILPSPAFTYCGNPHMAVSGVATRLSLSWPVRGLATSLDSSVISLTMSLARDDAKNSSQAMQFKLDTRLDQSHNGSYTKRQCRLHCAQRSERVQCKSTNELLMWGEVLAHPYLPPPHIADHTAAHVCTRATGRTFIADKSSKRRFLNDTGSYLCVFPCKVIPQHRSGIHYGLCSTNGIIILTYGWLPLSLNLGLRRDHTARSPSSQDIDDELQHLWHQSSLYGSRNKTQAPSSPHTVTRLPDNLDRTFQPLNASKCSSHHRRLHLPKPCVAVIMFPSPHASTSKQQYPRGSSVETSTWRFLE
jgi:hypothetical protein